MAGGHSWRAVREALARSFRVLVYDRRGHSASTHGHSLASCVRREHEDDLAALIKTLGLGPAHVAGVCYSGSTVLGLAARHPALFRSVIAHESPLLGIVDDGPALALVRAAQAGIDTATARIRAGSNEEGARGFLEDVVLGPGVWGRLPGPVRDRILANTPVWAAEQADPHWAGIDLDALSAFPGPALLTYGADTVRWLPPITVKLAEVMKHADLRRLTGVGHSPHVQDPDAYVNLLTTFIADARDTTGALA
ncbi:alpha/beta fold hydrolase [Streptomyces sp. NPDC001678]|uniref:alpha/beta fold hydrolase n=1 Tax=Streptomyces sp. NPDC001678 TaxID=3364599 RepID=UPI0036B8ACA9